MATRRSSLTATGAAISRDSNDHGYSRAVELEAYGS
jgi:hypothetical protein